MNCSPICALGLSEQGCGVEPPAIIELIYFESPKAQTAGGYDLSLFKGLPDGFFHLGDLFEILT
jgi:hypothetical protein